MRSTMDSMEKWAAQDEDPDALEAKKQRQEQEDMKQIELMNKHEDWADERDGVAQTKGKLMKTTGEDKNRITMTPKEQRTKIQGKLKDMRCFVQNEQERQEAIRRKRQKDQELLESDEEKERHDEVKGSIATRPNPLEIQPKHPKKAPLSFTADEDSKIMAKGKQFDEAYYRS